MFKKTAAALFLGAALTLSMGVYAEEADSKTSFEDVGMNISIPDLSATEGFIEPYPYGAIDSDHHAYVMLFAYEGMPKDQAKELLYSTDLTEEQSKEVEEKQFFLAPVIATESDFDAAVEALQALADEMVVDKDRAEKIGEADGYTFYSAPLVSDEYLSRIDETFAKEYKELESTLIEAEKNAEFYAPVDSVKGLVGQKLSFTTTDTAGNTVTSEELFSKNKVTMVNCWGLWCPNCTSEMAELGDLHREYQEKGGGVIGLEFEDTKDEETYKEAADFMKENNADFPNVVMPKELEKTIEGYPTSYFVDSEGTILSVPIVGAMTSFYRPIMDGLLEGEESDPAGKPISMDNSVPVVYTVTVSDENGPVEEVSVQLCSESACTMKETDEDGVAKLEGTAGTDYEVHIVDVPEGYAEDDTVYHFEDGTSLEIKLKKEN